GKGIGKGIAMEFARRGARVAIGCNANPAMAQDTLAELKTLTDAYLIPSDVGTPSGCEYLVGQAVNDLGGLDVLVNNAAIQTHHSFIESNLEIFTRVINVNLRAAFLMMKYAAPHLKESGNGRIVVISSVHGKRPTDFDAAYATSKGGLEMLTREAALELGHLGITVNIVAPGGVKIEGKTGQPKPFSVLPRHQNLSEEERLLRFRSVFPSGRGGLPSDAAAVVCFLALKEAEHITGTTIRVDGGSMLT
ncbi:MAG: SDR family oxidoreductase, partial [Oscillospiraceae bacterium]|nr:SDR family oxidoreductase [Oscillospiraceae bacterium]